MLSLKYLLVWTRQVAWALQGQRLLLSPVQALVTRALTPLGLWVLLLPKVGTSEIKKLCSLADLYLKTPNRTRALGVLRGDRRGRSRSCGYIKLEILNNPKVMQVLTLLSFLAQWKGGKKKSAYIRYFKENELQIGKTNSS